jgi:CheY-like chemotaxis protein
MDAWMKKKILMIDDEEDLCYSVKTNLELTGEFDVIAVSHAEEGIRLAQKEQPDLILLDVIMPDMSGEDVAIALSDVPKTKDIPIIFLTAVVTYMSIPPGTIKRIGGRDFISKPIDRDSLIKCIKTVI